ncbi:MAG: hypothetical protein AAF353_21115, partial [Pseudomonadota bacterium]
AHAVINLYLLRRNPDHLKTTAIVTGAVIPDLVIIVFYAWHLFLGTPEQQIWSVEYYNPQWQASIDIFNSIPIFIIAILICAKLGKPVLIALFASLLLHTLGDLPLHHDDAHRHFFPVLDWRFESPLSYWDPAHHGNLVALAEFTVVMAASVFLWIKHAVLRPWIVVLVGIYLAYWVYVFNVWM